MRQQLRIALAPDMLKIAVAWMLGWSAIAAPAIAIEMLFVAFARHALPQIDAAHATALLPEPWWSALLSDVPVSGLLWTAIVGILLTTLSFGRMVVRAATDAERTAA